MNEQLPLNLIPENIAGQNSSIRAGDINNPDDFSAVKEILESDGYKASLGFGDDSKVTAEDVKHYFRSDPQKDLEKLLGETKTANATWFVAKRAIPKSSESGDIQGFISLANYGYPKKALEGLDISRKDLNLITSTDLEFPVIEIFMAKHPNAPSGQMAAATRQVAWKVFKTAIESSDDLENGDNPKVMMLAHIEKSNLASILAVEASGFVLIGEMGGQFVYQMDWNILKQKIETGVEKQMITSIRSSHIETHNKIELTSTL